jgi:predicted glycosyltransferase
MAGVHAALLACGVMESTSPEFTARRTASAAAAGRPRRVVLTSHDGFGLGHARRNSRIAAALRAQDPTVEVTLVTGLASEHDWLGAHGVRVVRVPAVTKDAQGRYTTRVGSLAAVLRQRARITAQVVEDVRPDVLLVDRHPLGVAGELRRAVVTARRHGAAVVLGLRDILDEPPVVRAELAGPEWADAGPLLDEVLVYGSPAICDHVEEYGLRTTPVYCGIVTAPVAPPRPLVRPEGATVLVTAGGGGDGDVIGAVVAAVADTPGYERVVVVRGPAARWELPSSRVEVLAPDDDCTTLYAAASASVQMGGYNSTYEAIVSGLRPLLVPRRAPRREQAIRAGRLACLGLADVLDPGAGPDEVRWLLDRPRLQTGWDLARSGLDVDGAARAAARVLALAGSDLAAGSRPLAAVAR